MMEDLEEGRELMIPRLGLPDMAEATAETGNGLILVVIRGLARGPRPGHLANLAIHCTPEVVEEVEAGIPKVERLEVPAEAEQVPVQEETE